ncbi:MAG: hypothetical protein WCL44_03655 [bacterium]
MKRNLLEGCSVVASALLFVGVLTANAATVPWAESFGYATDSDLNGQGGWVTVTGLYDASGIAGGCSEIRASVSGRSSVAALSNDTENGYIRLSQDFTDSPAKSVVWAEFYGMPVRSGGAAFAANCTAVFYFNASGQTVAYDYTNAITIVDDALPTVPANQWTKFTVRLQYGTKKWDLWINGTNVVSQYSFYNTDQVGFENMSVVEGSTTEPSYLDSVAVGESAFSSAVVHNARATSMGGSSVTLNGELAFASGAVDCRIFWGPTDGGTDRSKWSNSVLASTISIGSFSKTISSGVAADTLYYYRCCASNETDMFWADDTYVWMAQTRRKNAYHLSSLPTSYGAIGSPKAYISSDAGAAVASGMTARPNNMAADYIWIQTTNSETWGNGYLNTSAGWSELSGVSGNAEIHPGMGFWLRRSPDYGDATSFAGFSGPKPTITPSITFPQNKWRVFGWPHAAKGATELPLGWGFSAVGKGTRGSGVASADLLYAEYNNKWYMLYLGLDGNWWRQGAAGISVPVKLQPGKAYYYFHRGATMTWTPPVN